MVNSARVRLKLDEQRISELLQESSERNLAARGPGGGMSEGAANATARILACLGDMGIASFTPGVSGRHCCVSLPAMCCRHLVRQSAAAGSCAILFCDGRLKPGCACQQSSTSAKVGCA